MLLLNLTWKWKSQPSAAKYSLFSALGISFSVLWYSSLNLSHLCFAYKCKVEGCLGGSVSCVQLRLRPWSHGSWVWTPHPAHCCQLGACFRSPVPLSAPFWLACSLSKINLKKKSSGGREQQIWSSPSWVPESEGCFGDTEHVQGCRTRRGARELRDTSKVFSVESGNVGKRGVLWWEQVSVIIRMPSSSDV